MTFSTPDIQFNNASHRFFFLLLILIACVGGALAFPISYLTNSNELIGLLLIPFVVKVRGEKRFNFVFAILFILLGVGTWFYHVRMFYFFSLAFFFFWLAEVLLGRINMLSIFLLLFMSPVFYQVTVILGFPIRLQLSQMAGIVLQAIGAHIQVEGNIILVNGNDFAVDEACMGLNMTVISMLMAVFIVANHCRVTSRSVSFGKLTIFFCAAFALNIVANLFRIVLLVFFHVIPENPMHEVTGIVCLILYLLIPLYAFGKWIVYRYGQPVSSPSDLALRINFRSRCGLVLLSAALLVLGWELNQKRASGTPARVVVTAPGLKAEVLDHEVTKLANEKMLIYIKPIQEFFSGEHTPLICWKGSGYKFKNIGTTRVGVDEVYCGQLTRRGETLFTAWWYDNGKTKTISQLNWRLRTAKGEKKFSLINVTAADQKLLKENVKRIYNDDFFKINYEIK
jgi:exosortase N